jgi:hypothetical protein
MAGSVTRDQIGDYLLTPQSPALLVIDTRHHSSPPSAQ